MPDYPQCLKYQAAYRVAFVTVVFFLGMACLTAAVPAFHNQVPVRAGKSRGARARVQGVASLAGVWRAAVVPLSRSALGRGGVNFELTE